MKKLICALLCASGLSANAERIHCRFEPDWRPSTYIQFDTRKNVAETLSGWDDVDCPKAKNGQNRHKGILLDLPPQVVEHQCLRTYKGVELKQIPNAKPYLAKGLSIVGFDGEVIFVNMRLTHNARLVHDDSKIWPYEAYWGHERLPANPDQDPVWYQKGKTRGVCWTDTLQGVDRYPNR